MISLFQTQGVDPMSLNKCQCLQRVSKYHKNVSLFIITLLTDLHSLCKIGNLYSSFWKADGSSSTLMGPLYSQWLCFFCSYWKSFQSLLIHSHLLLWYKAVSSYQSLSLSLPSFSFPLFFCLVAQSRALEVVSSDKIAFSLGELGWMFSWNK